MNEAVSQMLARYDCKTTLDYENALKEILQELALLGLWRAKFFEHTAFYGGSALRILYGLNRFSEDLDFSLLASSGTFSLSSYYRAVQEELLAFGFESEITELEKQKDSTIQSAFIKTGTKQNLIQVGAPAQLISVLPKNRLLKIKFEIDVDPPPGFLTEVRTLLQPIPFSVLTYSKPDLFAGKLHAILCRGWKNRVKGRDWYDFVWYVGSRTPVHLSHLKERLVQSGAWTREQGLTVSDLKEALLARLESIDLEAAKQDVRPFLKDQASVELWGREFFGEVISRIVASS
jgi:predicted nucleotidyltransferase component of viral defense system